MKKYKSIMLGAAFVVLGTIGTSCDSWLELEPIDNYGSQSYWKNEAQVSGYVDGLHKHLRDAAWQHTILFGEIRGGQYVSGTSSDGMTTNYGDLLLQNLDADHTGGVKKFGDLFGRITNCNLLIARTTGVTYMPEAKRDYFLAIAYGLRAFYYFDLYRTYGGVPLRLDVAVIDGELDPVKLFMKRAAPSEVMAQIKSDVKKSIELFGTQTNFDPYGKGKKCYWNKAASECLAAEVHLWNAKVTTGDQTADPNDLAIAKQYLHSVEDNYGLRLLPKFTDIFDAKNGKANDEVIFAVRYLEGEQENSNSTYLYSCDNGMTQAQSFRKDGTPWNDPLGLKKGVNMSMEYQKPMFTQFDETDTRLDATFMGSYRYDDKDKKTGFHLYGVHTIKNIGYINSVGNRVYCGDYIFYRLAWVYLSLAEIANMEGDNANVEKYINLIRERAYGDNWDKETYGYKAGDFTQNELAIFAEKNKEFVQEGQRWWDLCRMTLTKGGKHLVFCKEVAMDQKNPVLKEDEAYKVLWPIDQDLLDNDNALEQTPGYPATKK